MTYRLDFDPGLPDLAAAFDAGLVVRTFEERWPGRADGAPVNVRASRLQDTKYQPGARCVTTHVLQLERPGTEPEQTIGVVEVTPGGLFHRLYSDDPRLPTLAAAADGHLVGQRLARLLEPQDIAADPGGCRVTPVRYRPGARCVFRYDLPTSVGTRVFFGKLQGDDAARQMDMLSALHEASRLSPALPRILPPLAYWPDLQLLIQPEVVGRAELNDLAFDPAGNGETRERWLRDAGAKLAGLHELRGVDAPSRTLDEDVAELREYLAPMAAADPPLAARYERGVAAVEAAAADRAPLPPVTSHGAFRTDQYMIEEDALVMIDLDGVCWASPARDLGNYLAYLRWKQIRRPQLAALIERAERLFLEGYGAKRPVPDGDWLTVYTAASMLKIAGRRYRSLTVKEWPLVPALLDGSLALLGSETDSREGVALP